MHRVIRPFELGVALSSAVDGVGCVDEEAPSLIIVSLLRQPGLNPALPLGRSSQLLEI